MGCIGHVLSETDLDPRCASQGPRRRTSVPSQWRDVLNEIVKALAEGDYLLQRNIPRVEAISPETAERIRRYVEEYGERLVELPPDTWTSSIARWMRTRWDVLVDLWTEESGASDLVLHARVFETADGEIRIEVHSVHVP